MRECFMFKYDPNPSLPQMALLLFTDATQRPSGRLIREHLGKQQIRLFIAQGLKTMLSRTLRSNPIHGSFRAKENVIADFANVPVVWDAVYNGEPSAYMPATPPPRYPETILRRPIRDICGYYELLVGLKERGNAPRC